MRSASLRPPSWLVARRPDLLARGRAACFDRLGLLYEEVDRGALGEVLAQVVEPAGLVELVAELLGRGVLARGGGLQRVEDVAVGRFDVLGLDHRDEDGLAAQRLLGV